MSETLQIVLSKLKNTEARPIIHISHHFVSINVHEPDQLNLFLSNWAVFILSRVYLRHKLFQDWVVSVPDGRIEVLTIIERYNTRLSAGPKKFGLKGETYHWTQSYHFNSRLYEKLLCSVFDILEDGQLVEVSFSFFPLYCQYLLVGVLTKKYPTFIAYIAELFLNDNVELSQRLHLEFLTVIFLLLPGG
jgi:hypothetical protein